MSYVNSNRLLSSFTIPGTHDSASRINSVFVATQGMTISDQLLAGIRYLDLRCKLRGGELVMYHGKVPMDQTLASVADTILRFLVDQPSETVLVQITNEGRDEIGSEDEFYTAVLNEVDKNDAYWSLQTTTPLLRDVRKKIQLVRRYRPGNAANPVGIDVTPWLGYDNKPDINYTANGIQFDIQDQ